MRTKHYISALLIATLAIYSCSRGIRDKHEHFEHEEVDTTGQEWYVMNISLDLPSEETYREGKYIRERLVEEFIGEEFTSMGINKMMKAYSDTARAYFIESNMQYMFSEAEMESDPEMKIVLRYEENLKIYPVNEIDSIITYARDLYLYQGGAHGLETRMYTMYDMRNGEKLRFEDIVAAQDIMSLTKKLHDAADKMRADGKMPAEDGIFNNTLIEPTNNFYITDSSYVFRYNPYDIAPYAYGGIEIAIAK